MLSRQFILVPPQNPSGAFEKKVYVNTALFDCADHVQLLTPAMSSYFTLLSTLPVDVSTFPHFQALRMDLGHGMIQNPAAEVAEVVEYLVACEKTLASLYTMADCLISWQVRYCESTGNLFLMSLMIKQAPMTLYRRLGNELETSKLLRRCRSGTRHRPRCSA